MDWKQYENEVFELFKHQYPNAEISLNVFRPGRYSKTERQCDVLIEDYVAGNRMTIVVDAKYFSSKVDVKDVDSFVGMLDDIGAHKGLLITQVGYSEAALNRAYHGAADIELDILNLDELKDYQGHAAMPFTADCGVFLTAPFGWAIDGQAGRGALAYLYQQGLTDKQAYESGELMYVNFWDRRLENEGLDELLLKQEAVLRETDAEAVVELVPTIRRDDARTILRKAVLPSHGGILEVTGYVEFERFIFFCVLLTPENVQSRNIRKLENIMRTVTQLFVEHTSGK